MNTNKKIRDKTLLKLIRNQCGYKFVKNEPLMSNSYYYFFNHINYDDIYSEEYSYLWDEESKMKLYIIYEKYDQLDEIDKKIIIKNIDNILDWMCYHKYCIRNMYNLYTKLKNIIDFVTYCKFWDVAFLNERILYDLHNLGMNLLQNIHFCNKLSDNHNVTPVTLFLYKNGYDLTNHFECFKKVILNQSIFEMIQSIYNNLENVNEVHDAVMKIVYMKYLKYLLSCHHQDLELITYVCEYTEPTDDVYENRYFMNYNTEVIKFLFKKRFPSKSIICDFVNIFVRTNQISQLIALIESGVDMSLHCKSDNLLLAVKQNYTDIVKLLVVQKVVSDINNQLLYTVVNNNNFDLFHFLINNGFECNEIINEILIIASKNGFIDFLRYFETLSPEYFTEEHYVLACISLSDESISLIKKNVLNVNTTPYIALTKICVKLQNMSNQIDILELNEKSNEVKLYNDLYDIFYRIINTIQPDNNLFYVLNKNYHVKLSYDSTKVTTMNVIKLAIKMNLLSLMCESFDSLGCDEKVKIFDTYSKYPHSRMMTFMTLKGYNPVKYKKLLNYVS